MSAQLLNGQVALVTGGAGGIGSAICHALSAEGANVIVGYHHSQDAAQRLCESLVPVRGGHLAMHVPVTDSSVLKAMATKVQSEFGRCDLLVNSAGTTRYVEHSDLDALDDGLIDHILSTNVRGPFAATRALLPMLRKSPTALVVNISSIAAVTANGSNVMYCASKAALDNMTRSLARALAPTVRVLSISPGLVDTEFVQQLDQQWRNEQVQRTLLKSLATPNQVAAAVVAAATHLSFTTGAIIPVDGGRQLS